MTARAFRTNQIKLDSQLVNLDESSQASPLLNEPSHPYCIDRLLILHCMTSPFCAQNISFGKNALLPPKKHRSLQTPYCQLLSCPGCNDGHLSKNSACHRGTRSNITYSSVHSSSLSLLPSANTSRVHCFQAGNLQDYNRNLSPGLTSFADAGRRHRLTSSQRLVRFSNAGSGWQRGRVGLGQRPHPLPDP